VVNEKIKQALRLCVRDLERRATGKAGIDVVPPFEFVAFTHLPAEQHDAAVAK
jgi:hypothetical protein